MHTILVALAVAALAQGATASADKSAVMTSVRQFVDAFNKGDTKTAAAACADSTSIIDEFPPYHWDGAGGCVKWMADYDAAAKKDGITDGLVTLGTPKHLDVAVDHAYVVVPADYTYKQKGKVVKETAAHLTVALLKGKGGWRIAGWAWTKN